MSKKILDEIDTPHEARVAIAKELIKKVFKNWQVVTLWFFMVIAMIIIFVLSFFYFGGLDIIRSIFN